VIDLLRADEKIGNVDYHDGGVTIFRLEEDTIVKIDKALYGCVESARLWFNHSSSHRVKSTLHIFST
jgi:hypothetical protein